MTPRQGEVLDLLCEGKAPKQIARQMNLSIHTVRQYVADLKDEHDAASTTDLVAKVLRARCSCVTQS